MQHASRNTQAASILLFFLLSFFYLRPSPRETRVFRSFKFSYSKPLSLSLSLSPCGKKNPERTFHVSTNFSPIRNHNFPLPHTSNFNSSNLILEINIYLVFISIKKIRVTFEEEERKCPTRSFLPLEDRPPSLFSPPSLPLFVPFSHPCDIESRFYGALARRGTLAV